MQIAKVMSSKFITSDQSCLKWENAILWYSLEMNISIPVPIRAKVKKQISYKITIARITPHVGGKY